MWGVPDFDHYTFLVHFAADGVSGDGMEHLTSSQIIDSGTLSDPGSYRRALESVSHEFFHVWNVKRLRPVEFGPWDWTKPANTRSLWIAEGITNYYGDLMMRRAELQSDGDVLGTLARVISGVENAPGSKLMSAEDSSMAAPFIDGAVHRQHTNLRNTSISYYTKGEVIGLALDLLIRRKTRGQRSLDDVMRRMYDEFYLKSPNSTYYLKGRGFTGEDFARAVSETAGFDMSDFFARHVRGVESPPYDEALAAVGLRLVKTPSSQTAGIVIDQTDRVNLRLDSLRSNSPAETAGLQQGDILFSIGGRAVTRDTWRTALNSYGEGERVPISVRRNGKDMELFIVMGPPDSFNYHIEEIRNLTAGATAMRAAWLSGNPVRSALPAAR
jgi:predicted metalloprotease with PDZ domain